MPDSSPRRLVVELTLPARELSPNSRPNRYAKAEAVKAARDGTALVARSAAVKQRWPYVMPQDARRFTVTIEAYLCKTARAGRGLYMPEDGDNLIAACKSHLDGLRDARVIGGDTAKHITINPPRLYTEPSEHQGRAALVLTIEEVTE